MPVELTTQNARNVLAVSGLAHIPVVKGQAKPLMRPERFCPEIHGAPPYPPLLIPCMYVYTFRIQLSESCFQD